MQFWQIYVHAYLYLGLSLYCIIRFKAASNWKNKQYSSKGYLRRKLTTLMDKNSFITWNCKFHALKQAVSSFETDSFKLKYQYSTIASNLQYGMSEKAM